MLIEVKPTDSYEKGLTEITAIVRAAKKKAAMHHPVFETLSAGPMPKPTLVFDIKRIEDRMQWLSELCGPLGVLALAAVKSCPDPRYLEAAFKYLDGFDISNAAEYACLPDSLTDKLVSITSPQVSVDCDQFIAKGNAAVIALDSQAQLDNHFKENPSIPYLLRVQGSDLINTSDRGFYAETRFGFSLEGATQVLQQAQVVANPPAGFHVHHGSERNSASTYRCIIQSLRLLALQLRLGPTFINLGGGWHGLDKNEIGEVLTAARRAFPSTCSIIMEPGQWYGMNSGFALGTIVNQVICGDVIKYTMNLSSQCHLKWSEPKLVYPMAPRPRKFREVQFFGATCYEGDTVGSFLLPFVESFDEESGFALGSTIILSNICLYSIAWNTAFNGIPRADILWWNDADNAG